MVLFTPSWGVELTAEQLKPAETKPLWTSSVSAGLIGNEKDGDSSIDPTEHPLQRRTAKTVVEWRFQRKQVEDSGEPLSADTERIRGTPLRQAHRIQPRFVALSSYQFNGTNDSGVNTVWETLVGAH